MLLSQKITKIITSFECYRLIGQYSINLSHYLFSSIIKFIAVFALFKKLGQSLICHLVRNPPRIKEMPDDVVKEFTYGGRITLLDFYINQKDWMLGSNIIWTKDHIEKLRNDFRSGLLHGSYGKHEVQAISRHIDQHMINSVMTHQYICNYILT